MGVNVDLSDRGRGDAAMPGVRLPVGVGVGVAPALTAIGTVPTSVAVLVAVPVPETVLVAVAVPVLVPVLVPMPTSVPVAPAVPTLATEAAGTRHPHALLPAELAGDLAQRIPQGFGFLGRERIGDAGAEVVDGPGDALLGEASALGQ